MLYGKAQCALGLAAARQGWLSWWECIGQLPVALESTLVPVLLLTPSHHDSM